MSDSRREYIYFRLKLNRFLHLQANINGLPIRTTVNYTEVHRCSLQPIRWTPAWVSTVQFLLFRAGSYSRSDGLQHGCLQSSLCCSELGHTADQMDSSMGVYSPVSAVQSWVTSSECTEPQHMHFLRRRMNYISGWLSYPDFKRPLAPVAFAVVSSRGAARGDRRKRHKHTNLW